MPIGRVHMAERPTRPGRSQATCYIRVPINVNIVIKVNEAVVNRLAEGNPDQKREGDANANHHPTLMSTDRFVFRFLIHLEPRHLKPRKPPATFRGWLYAP